MSKINLTRCLVLTVMGMVFAANGSAAFGESADLRLQKDVAKTAIRLGDDASAENAIIKLKTDFVSNDGLARVINEIASEYRNTHEFDKSCELYGYVLSHWPNDVEALWAQMRLVKVYNRKGDTAATGEALNKLFSDFQYREKIDKAACELGDYFSDYQQYEKAGQAYKYVVDNCPGSEYMLQVLSGLTIANIHLGDEAAAQAAIDRLKADFASNEGIARGICQVAVCYHLCRQLEKAQQLYGYVLSLSGLPQIDKVTIWQQTALTLSQMCQNDKAASQATLDKLCVDFAYNPGMPRALHTVAELCYRGKDYKRAASIWQVMLDQYPGKTVAVDQVLYLKGFCHDNLKEYTKAIECYSEVCNYQKGAFARRVPCRIGQLYRKLGNSEEAIEWLGKQCQMYPDSVLAERALFELGSVYQFDMKDYPSAVNVFQEYLESYSAKDRAAMALCNMALCYKEMGDVSQAIAMLSHALTQYPENIFVQDIVEQNAELLGGAN